MNPNEIKKALECCSVHPMKCKKCPYKDMECCTNAHRKDALDYINQLENDNEQLKKHFFQVKNDYIDLEWEHRNIKAATIKEFAERLKEIKQMPLITNNDIDNLVKEMIQKT